MRASIQRTALVSLATLLLCGSAEGKAPSAIVTRPSRAKLGAHRLVRRPAGQQPKRLTKPDLLQRIQKLRPLYKVGRGLARFASSDVGPWATSSITLGAAESTYIASKTTPLLAGIQRLGFVGGLGLTYSATRDLRAAKTVSQRLDAAGDLAWGIEGVLEFSPIFSGAAGKLAPMVGTIGGLCQTGVGIRRIWNGCRARNWGKVKLGALDVASGGLWLAWDLFGIENPVTVCGFVGLMIGREVFANRKEIMAWGKRVGGRVGKKVKRGFRRLRARSRLVKRRFRHFNESTLRRLGRGLDKHDSAFSQRSNGVSFR